MGLNLNMEAKKNGENDQNDDNVPFVYWQIFGITLHAYYNSLQDFILEKKQKNKTKNRQVSDVALGSHVLFPLYCPKCMVFYF